MSAPITHQQWNNQRQALEAELADPARSLALKLGSHIALGQLHYDAAYNPALQPRSSNPQTSQYSQALSQYEAALRLNPSSIDALTGQGNCLRHLGRDEEAIVSYDLALSRSPHRAELWINQGRSYEHLGNLVEALLHYERALQIHPQDYRLWNRHADLLYRQERYGGALISYAQALFAQPLKAEEITSQCLFLASPGPYVDRYQAAFAQLDQRLADVLSQAAHQDPAWGSLWKLQGERLAEFCFWLEAIACYDKALLKHPRNPELHQLRGQSLEALTRWQEAQAAYQQALALFLAKQDLEGEMRCREAIAGLTSTSSNGSSQHRSAFNLTQSSIRPDRPTQDWLQQVSAQAKKLLELLQ